MLVFAQSLSEQRLKNIGDVNKFVTLTPRASITKLFTAVIYRHSRVILFSVYYHGNYRGMEVYYHGKKKSFRTLAQGGKLKYCSNIPRNFNPIKCRYCSKLPAYFFNNGPRWCQYYKNTAVILTLLFVGLK
jgi:hypothetical protein